MKKPFERILAIVLGAVLTSPLLWADFQRFGATGGSTTIVIGTTPVTNGTDCYVLYIDNTVIGGNAGLCFDDSTNAQNLRLSAGTAAAALRLYEPSGAGTNFGALRPPATLGGDRTWTMIDADYIPTGSAAALTATRVPFGATGGLLLDDAGLIFDNTTNAQNLRLAGGTASGQLRIYEPSGSGSNFGAFVVPALGADRTYTVPDASTTIAGLGVAQTFTAAQTISSGVDLVLGASSDGFRFSTTLTPDSLIVQTSATSNATHFFERGDIAFDFTNSGCGSAVCTDPNIFIHSTNQATDQYSGLTSAGIYGRWGRALTESSATSVVRIQLTGNDINTGGDVSYTIQAADGTDRQVRARGCIAFAVRQSGATETCVIAACQNGTADASVSETEDANTPAISSGTLTYAVTCSTSPTNGIDIQINAVSSLTQTSLIADGQVRLFGPGQIIRQ